MRVRGIALILSRRSSVSPCSTPAPSIFRASFPRLRSPGAATSSISSSPWSVLQALAPTGRTTPPGSPGCSSGASSCSAPTVFNFFAVRYLPLAVTGLGPVRRPAAGHRPRRTGARRMGGTAALGGGRRRLRRRARSSFSPIPPFNPAALLSVGPALCYAGYSRHPHAGGQRQRLRHGDLRPGVATIVLTPTLRWSRIMPPTWQVAAALVGTGVAGGVGHWLLIAAHRDAAHRAGALQRYTRN